MVATTATRPTRPPGPPRCMASRTCAGPTHASSAQPVASLPIDLLEPDENDDVAPWPIVHRDDKPENLSVEILGPRIPTAPDRLDITSVVSDQLARHERSDVVGPLLGAGRRVTTVCNVGKFVTH